MRTAAVAIALVAGCGRAGFDPVAASDAAAAASCAATCGPSGTTSCCDSPLVPGGTFYRSYDPAADMAYTSMTNPATLSSFRLDRYEVTVGRFRRFVEAGMGTQAHPPAAGAGAHAAIANSGWDASWNASLVANTAALVAGIDCGAPLHTWTDAPAGNEDQPVNCLDWFEAMAFCIWDGGYLPTEAEWNYAAAGGAEQRAYPWSSPASSLTVDSTHASYACTSPCTLGDIGVVGAKPAGDGAWGQADLGGNVWEWVLDWTANYATPCDDCANLVPSSGRVFRGGSFFDASSYLRAGWRLAGDPKNRSAAFGVRCARPP
jgi:sulfatase modifying factor 1